MPRKVMEETCEEICGKRNSRNAGRAKKRNAGRAKKRLTSGIFGSTIMLVPDMVSADMAELAYAHDSGSCGH